MNLELVSSKLNAFLTCIT